LNLQTTGCFHVFLAAVALAGAADAHGTEDDLVPFSASYRVEWHGLNAGTSTLELTRGEDSTYVYRSTNNARGIFLLAIPDPVTETSTFRIAADTVQPLSYTSDNGAKTSRNVNLRFDWNSMRAVGTSANQPVDLALEKGAQDNLSVQIALMRELRKGAAPSRFALIDDKQIKQYAYAKEGEAQIDTALGKLDTVIYTSQRTGSPRVTRLWLAPAYGYLPVQGEQLKRGKREIEMRILSTTMSVNRP